MEDILAFVSAKRENEVEDKGEEVGRRYDREGKMLDEVEGEKVKGPDTRERHFILLDFLDLKTEFFFSLLNLAQKLLLLKIYNIRCY